MPKGNGGCLAPGENGRLNFAHLHVRSWFSFLGGGSPPAKLVQRAAQLGFTALALTDRNGVYGAVRFQQACRDAGVHGVIGAEVTVEDTALVLLCKSRKGYANLNRLLTTAHLADRDNPSATLESVKKYHEDLYCLTNGREGRLWELALGRKTREADLWLQQWHSIFRERLYVELCHGMRQGDSFVVQRLSRLANRHSIPTVATNDVRFCCPDDYRLYDLFTCIRHNIRISDPHPDRPHNAEQYLKGEAELRRWIPFPEAFANAAEIAANCSVDLLPEEITPPAAHLPDGISGKKYLTSLCREALPVKYLERKEEATAQLEKELRIITDLDLQEFFLVVREVVAEARRRGIRCAGRGSAANSIVAYLLDITAVDPIEHNLLFERFLHGGRKGTPDIDIDFDSDRRDEVIEWMEERFGLSQTAMTATLVTYRARSALRDVAKTLGWPLALINELTKMVPGHGIGAIPEFTDQITAHLGASPLVDYLLSTVRQLEGCPRHLGLHSGGMVLSRKCLAYFSPTQVSANGVKELQFDKYDIEALGLVKLDVLGLRMLATLSEAEELVRRHEDPQFDIDTLQLDDPRVYELMCSSRTIGLFQIESQGQMHMLAVNQPSCFNDVIVEVALFRPGPLQSGMVHPYIRRRQGKEEVVYDHPILEEILEDTYGIILFQEQVLEIAHRFAHMSLEEADDFRALMSKFRDSGEMERMRGKFVAGALGQGVPEATAQKVFDQVSHFVGYGFCRSHAAAFARTVYHSAYLKRFNPACYMAAVMEHRPGFYDQGTLEEEAKRFGVEILPPDINCSQIRFDVESVKEGSLAIRKPLTSVRNLSEEDATRIVWGRLAGAYKSVEDLITRVAIDRDVLEPLALAGALDKLAASSRDALWQIGVLMNRIDLIRDHSPVHSLFTLPVISSVDIPELPDLTRVERMTWDHHAHEASRVHPMSLIRRTLKRFGVMPIGSCFRIVPLEQEGKTAEPMVTIAGRVILRQRPATAKGVMFITLEDETGYIQGVAFQQIQEQFGEVLRQPELIVRGRLQSRGGWRGLVFQEAWPIEGMFGGYSGFASQSGGRDQVDAAPISAQRQMR